MPRTATGRPRGRPRTKGCSVPLELSTERTRRFAMSYEKRQLKLQRDREGQRKRRQDRLKAHQQQLMEDNKFMSSTSLFPKSYYSACLFPKDNDVPTQSVDDTNKTCVHCSAKLFAGEPSDLATMCCHNIMVKLEPIEVFDDLQNPIEQNNDDSMNYLETIIQI